MKKTLLLIINLFFFSQITFAQDFITTWQLVNGSTAISFGVVTQGSVSYTWETVLPSAPASGSGVFTGPTVNITNLPANATIKIAIQPQNLRRFTSVESYFAFFLIDVNQWGNVPWISMENAFKFCSSLQVSATDIPNLAGVTSLANMFESCVLLNSPFNLNAWNISTVTNLSGMFRFCGSFNQALSLWNTANVTDMSGMFEESGFNQNIGNWNTSNVINMSKMFKKAINFNRPIGNWNTANVTDMSEMFGSAAIFDFPMIFNQNIGNWNTSSAVNMSGMFRNAKFFNQNIGNWNTANVTNMSEMFQRANAFNQNIGNWNTGNVTNMAGMFSNDLFNLENESYAFANGGNSSIENWNTANVTNMSGMFFRANLFNHNLGNWALNPSVILTTMLDQSGLDCEKYSQTLIGWNTNPNTPSSKILGATFLQFGPEAQSAVDNLIFNKNWGFSGHDIITTVPEFDFQTVFCQGATITSLPTTSVDGISGTWSPELNNQETTIYTFTPNVGQCALPTTETLFINSNTIPTFTEVLPICSGQTLSALPNTSTNGVTGTWSPALNNTATTTYTFTPNANQCAIIQTLTITVNPGVTPTFDVIAPICSGANLAPLPTTSTNGITGTWSPALNNNATTTYTFTPNTGQCATATTLTITVNPGVSPNFTAVAPICSGATLADLPTTSTNGITGSWSPVLNNLTTTTYTFTPDTGQCATAQTMTITVNPIVTPNFAIVAPICSGGTLAPLPTTSTNGITGTWSPALNNLATTTYTFTPNVGQCATTTTVTIEVSPELTPTFNQVAPICLGETLSPLPTISTNGITGTWSPALNNTLTTTYTFTPNSGQCAVTMTIVVNENIVPIFATIAPICSGGTLAPLPTTSTNGITGNWSPALNNNATTTYIFTPNMGQCAITKTLTIAVNQIEELSGAPFQLFFENSTIADIVISPTNVIWYSSLSDALANQNPLLSTTLLIGNTTYYAVNDDGACRSQPFAVLVDQYLGINTLEKSFLKIYPNPVTSTLQITYNNAIRSVEIYSALGQLLISKNVNTTSTSVDMSSLPSTLYLLKIKSDNQTGTFKILKQ
jgi:surface protein